MWPDVRIIAGIDASTMTSDGTCRFVMPRSESTIASRGPAAMPASTAALIASASGIVAAATSSVPSPSLGLMSAAARTSPNSSNNAGRNVRTTWPNMIGSDTFIIVALRCTENSTSSACALAIWAARNPRSAATFMNVASTTSPASTGNASRRTVVVPSAATSSMRSTSSDATTTERSFERKSSAVMCATFVLESGLHAPIEWGCLRAYSLTDFGARRSELPSRNTGLTAEPLILS